MIPVKRKQKREAHCLKCNYKWGTNSKRKFVTCPNCLSKVKVEQEEND